MKIGKISQNGQNFYPVTITDAIKNNSQITGSGNTLSTSITEGTILSNILSQIFEWAKGWTLSVNPSDSKQFILKDATGTSKGTIDLTTLLNGKADVATTLAGYGITDAYTKTAVDQLVNSIKQFEYIVTNTLPTASENTLYKIYLIPSTNPKTQNAKDEFITLKSKNSYFIDASNVNVYYQSSSESDPSDPAVGDIVIYTDSFSTTEIGPNYKIYEEIYGGHGWQPKTAGVGTVIVVNDAEYYEFKNVAQDYFAWQTESGTPEKQPYIYTWEQIGTTTLDVTGKADKVSGATNGNFAGLDGNGNLTDSGNKASDFKTKQTAVTDPSASGNSIDFIDSISQNTNGVITATKKTVPTVSPSTSGTGGNNGLMTASHAEKLNALPTNSELTTTLNGKASITAVDSTEYSDYFTS